MRSSAALFLNISLLTKTKYKIFDRVIFLSLDYQNNILNYITYKLNYIIKKILWYT